MAKGILITFNDSGRYLQAFPLCGQLVSENENTLTVNVRGQEMVINKNQVIGKGLEVVRC